MLFVEKLFLWFLFYSFCGWVYESILVSILERRPVKHGFLFPAVVPDLRCGRSRRRRGAGTGTQSPGGVPAFDGRCQHTGIRHIWVMDSPTAA